MQLARIMTADPVTVAPTDHLSSALATMEELGIRHLPVVRGERVVGVISDRDLFEHTGWMWDGEHGKAPVHVQDVFQPDPLTAGPDDSVAYLAKKLVEWGVGSAPVVEHGRLLGIVTESDVLRAYSVLRESGGLARASSPAVEDCMSTELYTLELEATVQEARGLMRGHGVRHLPVVQELRVLGLVSDRDLCLAAGRAQPANTPVREIMTPEVQTIEPAADLSTAARTMGELKISSLPVIEGEDLVGMLTVTDVLEHCARALP